MTTDHVATRTLVKSPPELWAECSDAGSLARHIREFGEITITRLDPETSVAWEGEHASGTVLIEPSGWGTRVTLTAQSKADALAEADALDEPDAADEPDALDEPDAAPVGESQPAGKEEEADAKVEETIAESDQAVEADPGPARGRWRRLTARLRAQFRLREDEPEATARADVDADVPPGEAEVPAAEPVEPGAEAPAAEAPEAAEPPETSEPDDRIDPGAILSAALDSLGQAHHRPFSRA